MCRRATIGEKAARNQTKVDMMRDAKRHKISQYISELRLSRGPSLIAIELKVARFEPEYLGKLAFYLEALDRDVRKAHEQPSIGVLLCASKNDEVVEYALSRSLSPALIAEYQTKLPDKKLLQAKLHEFYLQNALEEQTPSTKRKPAGRKRPKMNAHLF